MHTFALAGGIQLFPDGTLFVHIAFILIMIWALNRSLYKPLARIMESREKNKGGRSSEAVEILAKVKEKEAAVESELLEARDEGYKLTEASHAATVAERERRLAEAKAEVAARLTSDREALAKEAAEARKAVSAEADKFADRIAGTIIGA
ncbi:MAG: hypothetical protein KF736_08490 [Acidobacteria bacterium]|nr:hypothetical protein [Acidobacteriota bacterium]MCW5950089.1 hypothetical protein [Pyrinomonadaceae bacterium]